MAWAATRQVPVPVGGNGDGFGADPGAGARGGGAAAGVAGGDGSEFGQVGDAADLAVDETDGSLPDIAPGVLIDGDDLGRWLERQKNPATWAQLLPKQQERLSRLSVQPAEALSRPAVAGTARARARPGSIPARPGSSHTVGREGRRRPARAA